MSESINYSRVIKNLPPHYMMTHAEQRAAYTRRGKALLRLNGFNESMRWGSGTMKAYAIYNEFGILAIAIGGHESEALDNAVDNDCLDSCLVDEPEADDDHCRLGNAGEPFDLSYINIFELHTS